MATRTQVRALRVNNPRATLQEIGDLCHVTKERVRQILRDEGLPTVAEREIISCKTCGQKLDYRNKTGYCRKHLRDYITHCPHGHPYDEKNTYINRDGTRECRACNTEHHNAWYHANREKALAIRSRYNNAKEARR